MILWIKIKLIWRENDQNEFEQVLEKIVKKKNQKEDDKIIIDNQKYSI